MYTLYLHNKIASAIFKFIFLGLFVYFQVYLIMGGYTFQNIQDADTMVVQRLRRWPNDKSTQGQRLVLARLPISSLKPINKSIRLLAITPFAAVLFVTIFHSFEAGIADANSSFK